ncbi:MAG TPA: cytochrome b [Burkholderiaceae bacterium]|nr:cytochrome b [Burkholderiaceae bacterium]
MSGSYTATARWLHWIVAALIFANLGLGLTMVDMPGITPTKLRYFNWHKWVGVTVFALVVLRWLWRRSHRPPALPDSMPRWERRAAAVSHALLYVLMFALPLSGYFYSLAAGFPVVYLGLLPLPVLIEPNPALKEPLVTLHHLLAWTMIALLVVHVGAALKHRFVDRDDVLQRMLARRSVQ